MMKTFEPDPPPDTEPLAHDLLAEIALLKESRTDTDMKQAGKLFADLLAHYEPFLRKLARTQSSFDGSTNKLDPDDLYWVMVEKIWDKPDGFNPIEKTPQAIKRQFIGWASRILKNHISDLLGNFGLAITATESIEEMGWDGIEDETPEPSLRAKLAAEILEEMDPDDAEIIRWSVLATPIDGTQIRTDAEERAALCRKLNVTEVGLRKRKQRALKRFREEFEARISQMA
jgi:DNA-directed RNA polymerase specialized sigma24 family protein